MASSEPTQPRAPQAGERVLSVRGLRVAFGKAQVLNGIDFHVDHGETLAVVGPNGAGKTTLLRALSRLNVSTSDELSMSGSPLPSAQLGPVCSTTASSSGSSSPMRSRLS